jgi:hypothetical protein
MGRGADDLAGPVVGKTDCCADRALRHFHRVNDCNVQSGRFFAGVGEVRYGERFSICIRSIRAIAAAGARSFAPLIM